MIATGALRHRELLDGGEHVAEQARRPPIPPVQISGATSDPNPLIAAHGETFLRTRLENVERFPSSLERQIRELNKAFWALFLADHLPSTSLYVSVRVSDLVLQKLRASGVDIRELPTESEYTLHDLIALIHGKGLFGSDKPRLIEFLEDARADAFDEKYSDYTYENDARRIENRWLRELLGDLAPARGDGSYGRLLQQLAKADLLILDDWGLAPLGDRERRDLLEIMEDRTGRRATLVTSQVPIDHWHDLIGDATFGDAILDRLVHHAHRITLTGGSLRKLQPTAITTATSTD